MKALCPSWGWYDAVVLSAWLLRLFCKEKTCSVVRVRSPVKLRHVGSDLSRAWFCGSGCHCQRGLNVGYVGHVVVELSF